MSQPIVARRYAQALYEEAERTHVTEQVDADVRLIREALGASRELVMLFESPVVPRERKQAVVRALFESRVQPVTLRFVELLVEKRREALFAAAAEAYQALRDEQLGIVEVAVRTAMPLDADGEKAVVAKLESLTGKRVRLSVTVDESLMGGMVVRVGDTVYDGSVSGRLATLRERLKHGTAAVLS